jgi:SAP domain
VAKAGKRPATTQATNGAAKVAKLTKADKGASTTKTTASKASQAKAAATSAAGIFTAAQAGGTSAGTTAAAAADTSALGKDAEKSADQAPKRERKKASDVNVEDAVVKVKAAKNAGTLGKLSLLELKAYLKSVGKPVGGKKAELIERVEAAAEP